VAAAVTDWRAVAEAHLARGEPALARRAVRRAIAGAEPTQLPELRLLAAWIEHRGGDLAASERALDLVPAGGPLLARVRCVRGLNSYARGEVAAAEADLSAAVTALRRRGDRHWLANALGGRGVARAERLRLPAAADDLAEARDLCAALGERDRVANCVHNLGYVAMRAGDLPAALRQYAEAERIGLRRDELLVATVDRAAALLAGGLVGEAAAALDLVSRRFDDAGSGLSSADACLAYARCAARAGDHPAALRAAERAGRMFRRQRRASWVAAADALAMRIRLAAAEPGRVVGDADIRAAVRAARREDAHGRWIDAAELRLAAARRADPVVAQRLLRRVASGRGAAPASLLVARWLARALLADTPGAVLAACRTGLSVVDDQEAALGALELRAAATELAEELVGVGLGMALGSADPATVLRWTERQRAALSRVDSVVPPRDPALAASLARLRTAEQGRLAELEREVRSLSLSAKGSGARRWRPPRVGELAERLGDTVLVSYAWHGGDLVAVTVAGGRTRLHRLGQAADVRAAVDTLRFALGVHLRTGRRQARTAAARAAARLDRLLLAPVVGDRPLVVVPAGPLHGLPWAALPSCRGRPLSVTPSASLWLRAARRVPPTAAPVLVAGPGLAAADREVLALHGLLGGRLITGTDSTVDQVVSAMDGASLVHVAAHGRFRADSPMFSAVDLADGPLYGYDLDSLRTAPHWLVLSACEGARGVMQPRDGLLGLATVLLRRGTTALIASTVEVPDELTADLMLPLHRHLRTSGSPAAALAHAQATLGEDLGFVCLGAG